MKLSKQVRELKKVLEPHEIKTIYVGFTSEQIVALKEGKARIYEMNSEKPKDDSIEWIEGISIQIEEFGE